MSIIRNLVVRISTDTNNVNTGRAQAQLSGLNNSAILASGALAVVGFAATKMALDLERATRVVTTVSTQSFNTLQNNAIELSNKYGVAATSIQNANYELISSLGDADNKKVLDFGVKLSIAGLTDVNTALSGVENTVMAYNMKKGIQSAQLIGDQMLAAQNIGKVKVGDFGEFIGEVVPLASNLQVATEDLFASIALLTNQGLNASMSMTGLKSAYSNIIKPSIEAAEAAKQIGLEYNSSHLKAVGWIQFLQEIKETTGGNSDILAKLFGDVRGLNAVMALIANTDTLASNMQTIKDSTGAVDVAFGKIETSGVEQMNIAIENLKNEAIKLGQPLIPTVIKISNSLTEMSETFGISGMISIGAGLGYFATHMNKASFEAAKMRSLTTGQGFFGNLNNNINAGNNGIGALYKNIVGLRTLLTLKPITTASINLNAMYNLFSREASVTSPFANTDTSTLRSVKSTQAYKQALTQVTATGGAYSQALAKIVAGQNGYTAATAKAEKAILKQKAEMVALTQVYGQVRIASVLATMAVKGLNFAANILSSVVFGLAIQFVMTGINKLINSTQDAAEKAKKLKDESEELIKTLMEQKDSLITLVEEYDNLSVKQESGNINTDDYKRLVAIQKELATSYDVTASYYDAEGNAYANSKQYIDARVEALNEELKAEKELLKLKINNQDSENVKNLEKAWAKKAQLDKALTSQNNNVIIPGGVGIVDANAENRIKAEREQTTKDIAKNSVDRVKYLQNEVAENKKLSLEQRVIADAYAKSLAKTPISLNQASTKVSDFSAFLDVNNVQKRIEEYNKAVKSGNVEGVKYWANDLQQLFNTMTKGDPVLQDFINEIKSLYGTDIFKKLASSVDIVTTSISNLASAIDPASTALGDINNLIYDAAQGQSLSGKEVLALTAKYPELLNAITNTADGYRIEESALEDVRKKQVNLINTTMQAEIDKTNKVKEGIEARLKAYKIELEALQTLEGATNKIKTDLVPLLASGASAKEASDQIKTINSYSEIQKKIEELGKTKDKLNDITIDPNFGIDLDKSSKAAEDLAKKQEDAAYRLKDAFKSVSDEIKNTADSLLSFGNMFDRLTIEKFSPAKLESRLKRSVKLFEDWTKNLQTLMTRGVNQNVLDELRSMGVSGFGITAGLAKSTDNRLASMLENANKISNLATEQATVKVEHEHSGTVVVEDKDGKKITYKILDEVGKAISSNKNRFSSNPSIINTIKG